MKGKRPLKLAWRWGGAVVAFALIAAAVLLTVLRLALPLLSEYRGALEARLSDYLDAPVAIGRLDVEWQGLGPQLRLVDLRVGAVAPRREAVQFAEAYVDLALAPGAPQLPFRIRGLTLVGLELEVDVDAAGRVELLGFSLDPAALTRTAGRGTGSGGDAAAASGFIGRLFAVERLQLRDARVEVHGPGDAQTTLPDVDIDLASDGERHRLSLAAELPPAFGERLRVAVDLRGRLGAGDWAGRVYVDGDGMALPAWTRLWPGAPVMATDGRVDAAAWTHWRDGVLQRFQLEADAADLGLARSGADAPALELERVGGRFAWRRRDGGWQLDAGALRVERAGRAWPAGGFTIARTRGASDAPAWRGRFEFLRLEDVAALARLAPLPETLAQSLAVHAPRGDVHDLAVRGSGRDRFTLAGRFEDLGWAAHGRVPGADGLDGTLAADADGGHVELDTDAAELRLPALFRGPLPLARLAGRVQLERGDDGTLHLASDRLALANADLEARARLQVRMRPGRTPWLDLEAELAEGDVGATSRYLPAGIMPDDVVAWLDRALEGGRVTDGTMRLRGPAAAFPFRGGEGEFDVDFEVADARIAFAREWPVLAGMRGRVHFAGPALTITADRARLYDSRVRSLRARFDDLEEPLLELRGHVDAPMEDALRALTETPLRADVGEPFRGATGAGAVGLDLALAIPLDDIDDTRVDGRFELAGASLVQRRFNLRLAQLRGSGRFTHDGLAIDGLAARLHGQPVTIGAVTRGDGGRRIAFTIDGRLGVRELLPGMAPGLVARTSGRAPWRVEVDVPAGDDVLVRVRARTSLRGMAVDLPPPFGKPASATRPLALALTLDPTSGRHVARIDYGSGVQAALVLGGGRDGPGVERARVRFGGGTPALPERPGIHLVGELDTLALEAWLALLAGDGGAGADGSQAPGPGFGSADLRIARVTAGGYAATGLRVRTARSGDTIEVDVASDEMRGRIEIPVGRGGSRAVRARFDWIDLALLQPRADATQAADTPLAPLAALRPGALPPLDLRIDRLVLDAGTVDDAALVTRPSGDDLTIHRLQFANPDLELASQGTWSASGGGRTRLRLTLTGDDFGAGLDELGHGAFMAGGSGRVTGELAWPGPPWSPGLAGLDGHVRVDLADGVIERVDVGPARILGLLSLNIQGALRSGFPYQRIRGRVDLAEGNAYTRGLVIEGSPGRIQVDGRTGLVARDYDQTIRFRPQLSRSLPVIGALSGGPAAGLAVAVIQGLLRNLGADVEKATELTYRLTGSWADPRVRRVSRESPDSAGKPDASPGAAGGGRP